MEFDHEKAKRSINGLLDSWHKAATEANVEAYFSAISEGGIFLGTDPSERSTREEFREWALPHFKKYSVWVFEFSNFLILPCLKLLKWKFHMIENNSSKRYSSYLISVLTIFLWTACTEGCEQGKKSDEAKVHEKSGEKGQAEHQVAKKVKRKIKPPIPAANPPYTEYTIDPKGDTTIEYHTGTKIHIPTEAFLTATGKVVKEKVNLRYREVHDPIGFFATGVPMTIQQNGGKKVFESAGMCDIRASVKTNEESSEKDMEKGRNEKKKGSKGKNERGKSDDPKKNEAKGSSNITTNTEVRRQAEKGKEVKVNPERKIEVKMASEVKGDFRVYHMNEEEGEWEQTSQGAGKTAPPPQEPKDDSSPKAQGKTALPQVPKSPPSRVKMYALKKVELKAVDIEEYSYKGTKKGSSIDSINTGNTQLIQKQVNFVHDAKPCGGSQKIDNHSIRTVKRMEGASFIPADQNACEIPQFVTGVRAHRLDGNGDLYKVTFYMNEDGRSPRTCTCKRVKSVNKFASSLQEEWADYSKALKNRDTARVSKLLAEASDGGGSNLTASVSRFFKVQNFGFINCDSPERYPTGAELIAKWRTKDDKSLVIPNLKIVTMDPKMIFDNPNEKKIEFDPGMRTFLWGITHNGALAYYPPEKFGRVDPSKTSHTFRMKVKEDIDSYEELRKTLLPRGSS